MQPEPGNDSQASNSTMDVEGRDDQPQSLFCGPCSDVPVHRTCLTNLKRWACKEVPDEDNFYWKPCDCGTSAGVAHGSQLGYFTDAEDPRRLPFDPTLDYTRDETGVFADPRVQNLYYYLQLANQMHSCCFTCWKYALRMRICRFGYPRCLADLAALLAKANSGFQSFDSPVEQAMAEGYMRMRTDGRGRKRFVVEPPFNNAHLNNHAFSPLLFIAQRANMDIKFLQDKPGIVEYVGDYASKSEQPDFKRVGDIYVRQIAGISRRGKSITDLNKLNAVGNALIDSQIVGAPQMCFLLLGLPFVVFSRPIEVVNPLHKDDIRRKVKSSEARSIASPDQTALVDGANSHFGKRRAYGELVNFYANKGWVCNVTFYALRTQYTTQAVPKKEPKSLKELDHELVVDAATGFISQSEQSFKLKGFMFSKRKKQAVIHLSPHVPADAKDERSAYMILLLHHVWPNGEPPEKLGARAKLADLRDRKALLPYVDKMLEHLLASEKARADLREANQSMASACDACLGLGYVEQVKHRGGSGDHVNGLDSDDDSDGSKSISSDRDPLFVDYAVPTADSHSEDDFESDMEDSDLRHTSDRLGLGVSTSSRPKYLRGADFTLLNDLEYEKANHALSIAVDLFKTKQSQQYGDDDGGACSSAPVQLRPVTHAGQQSSTDHELAVPRRVKNYSKRKAQLDLDIAKCDADQLAAFQRMRAALEMDGTEGDNQLLMFVSGEGGTGKSHLIKIIDEYANITYGWCKGRYGRVIKWAPTGAAAFNIGGITWQSGVKKARFNKRNKGKGKSDKYREIASMIEGAQLLILEEVSMIGLEDIAHISETLARARSLLESTEEAKQRVLALPCGGLHVIFVGDLYQLPPVERTPVYVRLWNGGESTGNQTRPLGANGKQEKKAKSVKNLEGKKEGRNIWDSINAYIRLSENHRVKQSSDLEKQFAAALSELREGRVGNVAPMLNYLNKTCVVTNTSKCIAKAPKVSQY